MTSQALQEDEEGYYYEYQLEDYSIETLGLHTVNITSLIEDTTDTYYYQGILGQIPENTDITSYYSSQGVIEPAEVIITLMDSQENPPPSEVIYDVYDQNNNKISTITSNNGTLTTNITDNTITSITIKHSPEDTQPQYYQYEEVTINITWLSKQVVYYTFEYEQPCYWGVEKNIILIATTEDNTPLANNTLTINGGTLNNLQVTTDGLGQAHFTYNLEEHIQQNTTIEFTATSTETRTIESTSYTFQVIFIPWDQTIINFICVDDDISTEIIDGIKYDIPTTFNLQLLSSPNGTPLEDNTITIKDEENTIIKTLTTDNEGNTSFTYTPETVGVINFLIESTETYHYEKTTSTVPIRIDKDTPILTVTHPTIKSLGNETIDINCQLTNSIQNPITNATLKIYNYNTLLENGTLTTDNEGTCTYSDLEIIAGLRGLQTIFEETWCYYQVIIKTTINYKILEEYTIHVNNGEATLTIDDKIPIGLYDIFMEYISPNEDTCNGYNSSNNLEYARRKIHTEFKQITTTTSIEAGKNQTITVQLINEKNNPLSNQPIISKINDKNIQTLTTDNEGKISRNNINYKVGDIDTFTFEFTQTQKYTESMIEIQTNRTKITPIIEAEDVTQYATVNVELKAKLYYEQDKLQNNDIIEETVPIANKLIKFMSAGLGTTLTSGTTDNDGIVICNDWHKSTPGEVVLPAVFEGDETFNPVTGEYTLITLERIPTVLTTQDITAILYIPCNLTVRLQEEETGADISGAGIRFKQTNILLGTANTDNYGYATIQFTPTKIGQVKVQVIHYGTGTMYAHTEEIFLLTVTPITPTISISTNKNEITYPEQLLVSSTLLANTIPIIVKTIYYHDNDKSVGKAVTNNEGIAVYTYIPAAGTHIIYTESWGNNTYNEVTSSTKEVIVNKGTTQFYSEGSNPYEVPGGTSQTITLTLKDATGNNLADRTVQINYDNETINLQTDESGKILFDTGILDKDVTKTAVFTFEGDSNYNGTTYTLNLKGGDYINQDNCDNLDAFDIILENWYASDGKAYCGLDVNELNQDTSFKYKNNSAYINTIPVSQGGYNDILLRNTCDDLKTSGEYDEDTGKIVAPTGVIVRSNKLVTTSNCTVSFYFEVKYDNSNYKVLNTSGNERTVPNQFGGHFGLMEGGDVTTAEKAPIRFEFYRTNTYMIMKGGKAQYSNLAYALTYNEKYYVEFNINGNTVTISIYKNNTLVKTSQTYTYPEEYGDLTNLHPYAFAYTNGTKFVLSELKITRN